MSAVTTQWIVDFTDNISAPVDAVTDAAREAAGAVESIGDAANNAKEEIRKLSVMDLKATADSIRDLTAQFREVMQPGMDFEVRMKNVQAITRMSDTEMEKLGDSARNLAKEFGGDASAQLESFGAIIARFGPDIVKDNEAFSEMGRNVSVLSKSMGGDAVGAMDALTTAMLQFGIDLSNPQTAASEMTRMMNVMAAAGNEGASEVKDTAEALKNAGVASKNAKLSFEETNAALQALAQGGRVGAEAGVSLRNVLGKMGGLDIIHKKAQLKIKELGINFDIVSDKTLPFTVRLRELQKAQGDATLITQIFGIENEAAANILLNSINAQEEMTQKITGTNAAMESADIIMGSTTEKMSRMSAWVNDLKIGFFDVAGSITPFVSGLGMAAFTIANVIAASTGIASIAKMMKSLEIGTKLATAAQWLLNTAFISSPIGWIVLAVGALVGGIILAWNKFEGFRKVVLGVWEVIKGFGNILKEFVINRIKSLISGLGAMANVIAKLFSGDFSGAWESAKQGFMDLSGISDIKKAAENIGEAYAAGAQKGAASWAASQEAKSRTQAMGMSPLAQFQQTGSLAPVTTNNIYGGSGTNKNKKGSGTGSGDGVKLAGSGGSGGKTITMTVNQYFSGFKGTRELAEEVARAINNRLSDGLAVLD